MTIETKYNIGDEVWTRGPHGTPIRVIVADVEVIVKVLPKGRRDLSCAIYKPSWAIGTTRKQIEELLKIS